MWCKWYWKIICPPSFKNISEFSLLVKFRSKQLFCSNVRVGGLDTKWTTGPMIHRSLCTETWVFGEQNQRKRGWFKSQNCPVMRLTRSTHSYHSYSQKCQRQALSWAFRVVLPLSVSLPSLKAPRKTTDQPRAPSKINCSLKKWLPKCLGVYLIRDEIVNYFHLFPVCFNKKKPLAAWRKKKKLKKSHGVNCNDHKGLNILRKEGRVDFNSKATQMYKKSTCILKTKYYICKTAKTHQYLRVLHLKKEGLSLVLPGYACFQWTE